MKTIDQYMAILAKKSREVDFDIADLQKYLNEEYAELSKREDETKKWLKSDSNKNNLIIPWLDELCPSPSRLQHSYTDADLPDVDCDFTPEWRDKLKDYLKQQYGEKNCIEVGTFHMPTVKTTLLDLGRLYGVPQSETFAVTKEISHFDINDHNSGKITIADLVNKYKKLDEYFMKYPEIRTVIEEFKGVIRQIGVHASAFIISPKRIDERIPIIRKTGGGYVTGHSENAGSKDLSGQSFVKMDILGSASLSIVQEALKIIKQRRNVEIDWDLIDVDDKKTYDYLQNSNYEVCGIFQYDGSSVAQRVFPYVCPSNLVELANVSALMRPGNLDVGAHKTYHAMKFQTGEAPLDYPDWTKLPECRAKEAVSKAYGIPMYQEHLMFLVMDVAGFTMSEANKFRKMVNMSGVLKQAGDTPEKKKAREQAESFKKKWFENAQIPEEEKQKWWNCFEAMLRYSFNQSHALSYSFLSFQQLYLKANYTIEFFCALLNGADGDKFNFYLANLKRNGITMLPPDINYSELKMSIAGDHEIMFGFEKIKRLTAKGVAVIQALRPFKSWDDFMTRAKHSGVEINGKLTKIGKVDVESLIKAGALSKWGNRSDLWAMMESEWRVKDTKKPESWLHEEFDTVGIVLSYQISGDGFKFEPLSEVNIDSNFNSFARGVVLGKTKSKSRNGKSYYKVVVSDYVSSREFFFWENKQFALLEKLEMEFICDFHIQNKNGFMTIKNISPTPNMVVIN